MKEMTLPSRQRMPDSLPLGPGPHNIEYLRVSREETFFFFNLNARAGFEPTISDFSNRPAALTTALGSPPCIPARERSSQ